MTVAAAATMRDVVKPMLPAILGRVGVLPSVLAEDGTELRTRSLT